MGEDVRRLRSAIFLSGNVTCAIGLRPLGWRKRNEASAVDLGSWAVTIVVTDRPLSEVARNAGFAKSEELANTDGSLPGALEPGGWAIDSLGIAPARHFHTACCEALRGSTVSRGAAKDGTKASFSSDVALLSRKRRSAIFNTAIDEEFSDVLTEALKSFRFLP